jgi:hypothetical protein
MTFELLRTRRLLGERSEGRSRMVRSVISLVARRTRRSRAESRGWAGEVAIRSWGIVMERRLFRAGVFMLI